MDMNSVGIKIVEGKIIGEKRLVELANELFKELEVKAFASSLSYDGTIYLSIDYFDVEKSIVARTSQAILQLISRIGMKNEGFY